MKGTYSGVEVDPRCGLSCTFACWRMHAAGTGASSYTADTSQMFTTATAPKSLTSLTPETLNLYTKTTPGPQTLRTRLHVNLR